jgi:SOS-response transcriptional repressor LexA
MTHFGDTLRVLRRRANLSQRKLAALAGIAEGTIVAAEHSPVRLLQTETYNALSTTLARSLKSPRDEINRLLMAADPAAMPTPTSEQNRDPRAGYPIYSMIPAGGFGQYADQAHHDGYVPASLFPYDPATFALRVVGDSMADLINDGDLVLCAPALSDQVQSGDIVAVQLEGDDSATLKYLIDSGGATLELRPHNIRRHRSIFQPREHIARLVPVVVVINNLYKTRSWNLTPAARAPTAARSRVPHGR